MKTLAILGAGGHGKVVADTAELLGFQVVFFDDSFPNVLFIEKWPVIGHSKALESLGHSYSGVFIAIGDNNLREQKFLQFRRLGLKLTSLIHPSAAVSRYACISFGTIVMANVVINAYASVGSGCIINSNVTVEHDCCLEDFVHISPGAQLAGNVTIFRGAWVGIGASVKQGVQVGSGSLVGAGAVVVGDIPMGVISYGVPAKIVDKRTKKNEKC